MSYQVKHISEFFDTWAPFSTQAEYDNSGQLVGSQNLNITGILTCLDVTEDVVDEALERNCNVIVAHHPVIFRKLSKIDPDTDHGSLLYKLIRHDIAVLAVHTNLDAARDGVSFVLADQLTLRDQEFLTWHDKEESHGYGVIGNLAHEMSAANFLEFVCQKLGTSAVRFSGGVNEKTKNNVSNTESQITPSTSNNSAQEANLHGSNAQEASTSNTSAHEADLLGSNAQEVPTGNNSAQKADLHGSNAQEASTGINSAQKVNLHGSKIKRVAVCGGTGVSLAGVASQKGAQAFVTADIKYHEYFDFPTLLKIDAGHYETEIPIAAHLQNRILKAFPDLMVHSVTTRTNPMQIHISTDFKPSSTTKQPEHDL